MTSPESALHVEVVDDEIVVSLPQYSLAFPPTQETALIRFSKLPQNCLLDSASSP
jgi:hypothetical protein